MTNQKKSAVRSPQYGRLLEDFVVGDLYHHPWEVTIDDGMLALLASSFLDPNPLYSSRRYARDLGFRDRVVHPLVLMNLALSFSVHDVSEQVIAHLAYIDLKFPNAAYSGDTISVSSQVLGVRPSESKPDRGVVHVRTVGVNQDGVEVVSFERKALARAGRLEGRAHPDSMRGDNSRSTAQALPPEYSQGIKLPNWPGRPRGFYEDFETGETILHSPGRTVGVSEHMQMTVLTRNTHPIHFDEVYCRDHSFAKERVVEGGLVFAWIASLASRDTTASALWELSYDRGSHPGPVLGGDTLFAASRVLEKIDRDDQTGVVRFKLVGIKNRLPAELLAEGIDLFDSKFDQKVFEVERAVLLPKKG